VADQQVTEPDNTAVRVALWRAMHVRVDDAPHVLDDEIGLRLAGPADGWRERPDMDPVFTSGFRASIVARARFIEDLVAERAGHGTGQYVLLGAGLDTFAQRRPDLASRLAVFEVDQPGTQASTVAMTFMLPLDLVDERDRQGWIMSENGARSSGTPFVSFYTPGEFLDLARVAGFRDVRHVSGRDLNDRYFAGRADGLRMSTGEDFLVATT
jgi:O-methyltransferase involved in polyketide biosynthesis